MKRKHFSIVSLTMALILIMSMLTISFALAVNEATDNQVVLAEQPFECIDHDDLLMHSEDSEERLNCARCGIGMTTVCMGDGTLDEIWTHNNGCQVRIYTSRGAYMCERCYDYLLFGARHDCYATHTICTPRIQDTCPMEVH